ncbi:hypothetical protein PTD2_06769 [Pseudoalteromonas tunicata D2]|uniref:Uncharacterized protein n=1 Tax=Pseudoalteromonas tunicata D2 TaxID=87626 RepID=A4C809_9GAMM|nr:hypothetical protein PTD2_06769 [Pseudoalteromonas tunicata D2]
MVQLNLAEEFTRFTAKWLPLVAIFVKKTLLFVSYLVTFVFFFKRNSNVIK